jgi:hypothetical protein
MTSTLIEANRIVPFIYPKIMNSTKSLTRFLGDNYRSKLSEPGLPVETVFARTRTNVQATNVYVDGVDLLETRVW